MLFNGQVWEKELRAVEQHNKTQRLVATTHLADGRTIRTYFVHYKNDSEPTYRHECTENGAVSVTSEGSCDRRNAIAKHHNAFCWCLAENRPMADWPDDAPDTFYPVEVDE